MRGAGWRPARGRVLACQLMLQTGMVFYNASPEQIARVVAVWRGGGHRPRQLPARFGPVRAPISLFLARTVPKEGGPCG